MPKSFQIQLPQSEQAKLIDRIEQDFLNDKATHTRWMERCRRWMQKWEARVEAPAAGDEGKPNHAVPLVQWQTINKIARDLQALLGDEAAITARATGPADARDVHKIGCYMTSRVFDQMEIINPLAIFEFRRVLNGHAVAYRPWWKREFTTLANGQPKRVCDYEGPGFFPLEPDDLMNPPERGVTSIQDFSHVIRRVRYTVDDLQRGDGTLFQGTSDPNFVRELIAWAKTGDISNDYTMVGMDPVRTERERSEGVDYDSYVLGRRGIWVWEWYGAWRPLKKRKRDAEIDDIEKRLPYEADWVVRFIPGMRKIVGVQDLLELYPKMRKRRPFVESTLIKDGTYRPKGFGALLEEIEDDATSNSRLFTAAGELSVWPIIFFKPGGGFNQKTFKVEPGMAYPTEDPSSVNVINIRPNLEYATARQQDLFSIAERVTGITDQSLGRGESTDAAKVFRDSGMTPEQLQAEGVSLKGKIASEGLALSRLAQPIFDEVMSGDLSPARGAAIGAGLENHADQAAVYDLMKQRERSGRRLTNDQAGELIRMAREGPTKTGTNEDDGQTNLFGVEEMTRSLLPEKAEVSDYVRKQLGTEKKLFATVATQAAADKLSEQGNVIKAGENAQVALRANQGIVLYDKLSTKAGPIAEALDRAAQSLADGETPNDVKQRAYRQIRSALREQADQLGGVPKANDRGVEGGAPGGSGATGGGQHDRGAGGEEAGVETGPFGPVARQFSGKPREALDWVRQQKSGFAAAAIPHSAGAIGLPFGDVGDLAAGRRGYGVVHIDADHPGWLDQHIDEIPGWSIGQEFRDKQGRAVGRVLTDGKGNQAVVSLDWKRQAHPEWLLTGYEREVPASGTSVGVSEAPKSAGPTPPATGTQVPLSSGGSPVGPETTRSGSGEPPSPSSGAPDSRIAPEKAEVNRPPVLGEKPEKPAPGAVRKFLGDETGTSFVGDVLGRDAAEMRALKQKRDAALEELKKSKETPEQMKVGQDTMRAFLAERDVWGTRVNQAIGRVRKMLPDTTEREGLALMRDFKGREQEMSQFLDGSHPAFEQLDREEPLLRGLSGSDQATARRRIEQLRPAILKALNPTDQMVKADAVLTKIADATLKEGQRLGMLDSRWTAEQYNPHILHPQGEGEYAEPGWVARQAGKALGGKMGKYFGFAERREFPTLLHAVVNNFVPKTLNALDAFTIHGDKFATARATHLLEGQLTEAGMGTYSVKENAPKGWVPLAPHSTEFRQLTAYTDEETGEPDVAEKRLYVMPHVEKGLRPVTDPDYMGKIPLFAKMRQFQTLQKGIQLGLSMFHAYTENWMGMSNMGPRGWYKALRADRDSAAFWKAERAFVSDGGTTDIQGKTVEAYKSLQPGSIPTWTEVAQRAPLIHQLDMAANKITDFTFGNLQRRFKVMDYTLHKSAWDAGHPQATPAERAAAGASMAKEINAVYGGLKTELMGVNRATVEIGRAALLAPDWTFSNFANVKYAAERGTPAGKMARAFWARQAVGGVAATQLLSVMFSGKLSKNPTQVYFGKDKDGRDVYQNVCFKGASGDAINMVHDIADYGAVEGLVRFASAKAAGVSRAALQFGSNRDYLGHEIVAKGLNPVASTVRGVWKGGEAVAPVPFTVTNLWNMMAGPDAGKYSPPEWLTTFVAGNPPRHVAPEGTRMGKNGLHTVHEKPARSTWQEIVTGKR